MSADDIAFLKGVIAFLVLAGTGMGAWWLRLRARQLSAPTSDGPLELLRDENAQFRAEVEARVRELEERVDFVERKLVQGSEPPRRAELPRHRTPV